MPSPQRVAWAKFRATVVSAVAFAILATLSYLLTGGTLLKQRIALYLYIPDATGLVPASPVRVDGIGVGKVRSVQLSGSNEPNRVVKVTLTVERSHLNEIPVDSVAQISADTLAGDRFVDISSGRRAERIRPNGEIRYEAQPELMRSLDIPQFEKQLRTVDALLVEIEQGRSRVGEFIVGEKMYSDLMKRVAETEDGFRQASDVTTKAGQILYTQKLYDRIRDPIIKLDTTLARLQAGQGSAGVFLRDPAQYDELRKSAANLRSSMAEFRARTFVNSDEAYTNWNRSLASVIRSVDELSAGPLVSSTAAYDNLNGAAREISETFRDFRSNPKKFLRLKIF
jgi:phospholipid/cholesterol/gamma-HCH transport system substrate-binding protein